MADSKIIKLGILLELLDKVTGPSKKISQAFWDVEKNAKMADRAVALAQKNWSAGWKMMATGAALAAPFVFMGKALLGANEQMEQYRWQTRQAMGGSIEEGNKLLNWIMRFRKLTPFEPGPLVESAAVLQRAGFDAYRWLPMIGDAAKVTGKDVTEMASGIIRAINMGTARGLWDIGFSKTALAGAGLKGSIDTVMEQGTMIKFLERLLTGPTIRGSMANYMNTLPGLTKHLQDIYFDFRSWEAKIPSKKFSLIFTAY